MSQPVRRSRQRRRRGASDPDIKLHGTTIELGKTKYGSIDQLTDALIAEIDGRGKTHHIVEFDRDRVAGAVLDLAEQTARVAPRTPTLSVAIIRAMGLHAVLTDRSVVGHDWREHPRGQWLNQSIFYPNYFLIRPNAFYADAPERQLTPTAWLLNQLDPLLPTPRLLRPSIEDSLDVSGRFALLRRYHERVGDAHDVANSASMPNDFLLAAAFAESGDTVEPISWLRFSRDAYQGLVAFSRGNWFAGQHITAALYPHQSVPPAEELISSTVGRLESVSGWVGPAPAIGEYIVNNPFATVDKIIELVTVKKRPFDAVPKRLRDLARKANPPLYDFTESVLPHESGLVTAHSYNELAKLLRSDRKDLIALADGIELRIRCELPGENSRSPAEIRTAFGIVSLLRGQQKLVPGLVLPAASSLPYSHVWTAVDPDMLQAEGALYVLGNAHAKFGTARDFALDKDKVEKVWKEIMYAFDASDEMSAEAAWQGAHSQTFHLVRDAAPAGRSALALVDQAIDGHELEGVSLAR